MSAHGREAPRVRLLLFGVLVALLVLSAGAARASANAIIDNGTVQLGVFDTGNLNVPGGEPSSGTGNTTVGLRYLPTGAEATADGCTCEGWGVADAGSDVGSWADDEEGGSYNMDVEDFQSDSSTATSKVVINDVDDIHTDRTGDAHDGGPLFRVTHEFEPSSTAFLYSVHVTIENVSGHAVSDVRYRRAMDWDIEPTPFEEYSTIEIPAPFEQLRFASSNGFALPDPLVEAGGVEAPFTDLGPTDHGAVFDFGFGALDPGKTVDFFIYYGGAGTEADALNAIGEVGAETWSFGQPSTEHGADLGTPNTFIFAFSSVGGRPIADQDGRPPVRLRLFAPASLPSGGGEFDVTSNVKNLGDGDATLVDTTIDVPAGLTLLAGDDPHVFGTLTPGAEQEHTWRLKAPSQCDDATYPVKVTARFKGPGGTGEYATRETSRSLVVPGTCARFQGMVRTPGGSPLEGAIVAVCPHAGGPCEEQSTDAGGHYSIGGLAPGTYDLWANGPAGSDFVPQGPLPQPVLAAGQSRSVDITLSNLRPTPPDVDLPTAHDGSADGLDVVYWGQDQEVTTDDAAGCSITLRVSQDGDDVFSGAMTQSPAGSGHFTVTIPAFYPRHGYARITIERDCPAGDRTDSFDIYIDPSGTVRDTSGTPLPGVTVTLLRSDSPGGPFVAVPDGSAVMSPANRENPDTTDAAGHFGWDVIPGYYRVRAEKAGCGSTESAVLTIPPAVTDLDLRLDCGGPPSDPCARPGAILGTAGDDVLRGTAGDDVICARGGNDRIKALAGNDIVRGGDGNDRIDAGAGDDDVDGQAGNDYAALLGGKDAFADLAGTNAAYGGAGDDTLTTGGGRDHLDGGADKDVLAGGGGVDSFVGGKGDDTITAKDTLRESVRCDKGTDAATLDAIDRPLGCETKVY